MGTLINRPNFETIEKLLIKKYAKIFNLKEIQNLVKLIRKPTYIFN